MSNIMNENIKEENISKINTICDTEMKECENYDNKSNKKTDENLTWKTQKETVKVRKRWTSEEDKELTRLVNEYGTRNWRFIASHLPGRLPKQCRERWFNQLDPKIKKESLSQEEWKVLCESHSKLGNRWAKIIKLLPGRTANQIKNFWNTMMRRKKVGENKKRKSQNTWTTSQIDFAGDPEGVLNFENNGNKKKKTCESDFGQESHFNIHQPDVYYKNGTLPSIPIENIPAMNGYYIPPYSLIPVPLHYGMIFDHAQLNMYHPYLYYPYANFYLNNVFFHPSVFEQQFKLQPTIKLSPISNSIPDEKSNSSTDDEND